MYPQALKKGEYAAFLDKNNELLGGCIWWNVDEKNDKKFWTSHWWLFRDERDVKIDFYQIKDEKLDLITQKKGTLNISHIVKLGRENKGTINILI